MQTGRAILLAAMTIGTALIFVCGLLWLGQFVESDQLLTMGLYPFLPGAGLKIALASILLPVVWRFVGKK